jgi:hypothetical protein
MQGWERCSSRGSTLQISEIVTGVEGSWVRLHWASERFEDREREVKRERGRETFDGRSICGSFSSHTPLVKTGWREGEQGERRRWGGDRDQVIAAREDAHRGDHFRIKRSQIKPIDGQPLQILEDKVLTFAAALIQLEDDLRRERSTARGHKRERQTEGERERDRETETVRESVRESPQRESVRESPQRERGRGVPRGLRTVTDLLAEIRNTIRVFGDDRIDNIIPRKKSQLSIGFVRSNDTLDHRSTCSTDANQLSRHPRCNINRLG